eukprot:3392718-Pleurochrysis_carterae.AAC.1
MQRELRYAPTPARQANAAHPTSGGVHLPRAPHRRDSLRNFDSRSQRRKLVAVPDPKRYFLYPPHVADLQSFVTYFHISPTVQPFSTQHTKALEDAKIAADCSLVRDLLIQEGPTSNVTDDKSTDYFVPGLVDSQEEAARGTPFSRTHPFPT